MDKYECEDCADRSVEKKDKSREYQDREDDRKASKDEPEERVSGAKPAQKASNAPKALPSKKSAAAKASISSSVRDPWNGEIPDKTDVQLRLVARKGFETIFSEFFPSQAEGKAEGGSKDGGSLEPAVFAAMLETHMYLALRDPATFQPGEKYKAQYRSLRLNLKDASNVTLRSRILKRELGPETLAVLTTEQMASEEAMRLAEEVKKQSLKEVVLKAEADRPVIRKTHKGEEEVPATKSDRSALPPENVGATLPNDAEPTSADEDDDTTKNSIAKAGDMSPQHSLDNLLAQLDERRTSLPTGLDIVEGGKAQSPSISARQSPRSPVYDDDPAAVSASEPLNDPVIWKGVLQMATVASFRCEARQIAGKRLLDATFGHAHTLPHLSWTEVLHDELQVDGRVSSDKVVDYLVQQTYSTTKEVVVLQFENTDTAENVGAFSEHDRKEYRTLFEYFHARNRYGVIGPSSRTAFAKDMYIVPVKSDEPLPDFMEFVGASSVVDGVKRDHDYIFGVVVLVKRKPEDEAKAKERTMMRSGEDETLYDGNTARQTDDALASAAAALAGTSWDTATIAASLAPYDFGQPGVTQPFTPSVPPPAASGVAFADPLAGLANVNLSNLLSQIQSLNAGPTPVAPSGAWPTTATSTGSVSLPRDPRVPQGPVLDPSGGLNMPLPQAGQPAGGMLASQAPADPRRTGRGPTDPRRR